MDFNTIYNNVTPEKNNENPERRILRFLSLVGEILNSNFNLEEFTFTEVYSMDTASSTEYWDKTELKKILLSDNEFENRLVVFVQVILDFIRKQTENVNEENYKEIFNYTAVLSKFIKVCEHNNILNIKTCILKFLAELFNSLDDINSNDFIKKGSWYQFIARLIEMFKEIKFVQHDILLNVNNKLKQVSAFLQNEHAYKFHSEICYESLLIYLTILKEVLKYKLLQSIELNKMEQIDCVSIEINDNLNLIADKLPEFVKIIMQECKSLF